MPSRPETYPSTLTPMRAFMRIIAPSAQKLVQDGTESVRIVQDTVVLSLEHDVAGARYGGGDRLGGRRQPGHGVGAVDSQDRHGDARQAPGGQLHPPTRCQV